MPLELHPQLRHDCHELGQWESCHVLLHRNSSVPWYILVPETSAAELHELNADQRRQVDQLMDALARFLKDHHHCQHTNVAAIGNRVPQLHIHVVGRYENDVCWPDVVWGNLPPAPERDPAIIDSLQRQLMQFLERPERE